MWQQRHLFGTDDPNTAFLTAGRNDPRHGWTTLVRAAAMPVVLLDPPTGGAGTLVAVAVGLAGITAAVVLAVRRGERWLGFWAAWLVGTIGVVAALDLVRRTDHLNFTRYTLLAGPAVYALVPGLARVAGGRRRWVMPVVSAAVVGTCLATLPAQYAPVSGDPREAVAGLLVPPGPDDLLVFAAPPGDAVEAQSELLRIARYLPGAHRPPCAILTGRAGPAVAAAVRRSRVVYLFTPSADYRDYLPDAHLIREVGYRRLCRVFTLRP